MPYILGEIKRFIRDDGPIKVSRSTKELCVKIREIQKEYLNKKGIEIKIDEISKILDVSVNTVTTNADTITNTKKTLTKVFNIFFIMINIS